MKNRRIRTTTWIAAGTAGLLLLLTGACSSGNKMAEQSSVSSKGDGSGTAPAAAQAKKADLAMVRFVNATTDSKDLAFGDAIPFTGVDARDISAFKELPADRGEFKLMNPDAKGAPPLATNSEGLSAGKHYTIIAYLEKGKAKLDPIADDLTPPAAGQAKVRVINLAPSMEKIDLYAGGKKSALISGAKLDSPTDFKDVDPAEAELAVRHGMSKKNSAPVKDLTLKAGKLYTILVFEEKDHKIKVKTVEDEFNAASAGS